MSLLLSLFLLLFFCVSVSLTCFSLDLFVPHFGSWPVENRALIPQTVDCVPVIKPYLFLCFQSFVLSLIFFSPLSSSAYFFSYFFFFLFPCYFASLFSDMEISGAILTLGLPETKLTFHMEQGPTSGSNSRAKCCSGKGPGQSSAGLQAAVW